MNSIYVFESPRGEIRITVVAADADRAWLELEQRIIQIEELGVRIVTENFELVSAY